MKLLNPFSAPKYSKLVNSTIKPGKTSRDISLFKDSIQNIIKSTQGFRIIMSEDDLHLLAELCEKYLLPNINTVDISDLSAGAQLKATLEDPDGLNRIKNEAIKLNREIRRYRSSLYEAHLEREKKIKSEENYIGPDGNPIAPVNTMSKMSEDNIKPVLHTDMHSDLKSVLENNLAVMSDAHGNPYKNTVIAPPGGTPVSTNPKDYQGERNVPPGQPDFSDLKDLKAKQPNN